MTLSRILRRYPLEIGGAAVAAVCVAFSIPGMVQNFESAQAISRKIQSDANEQQRLAAQQEASAARALIANERYKSCLFVQVPGKNTLVSVTPGIKIVDTESKMPLAPGTVVCDISGNTGVIGFEGIVTDVAFTGDRQLVANALRRSGLNLLAGDPNFGSSNRTYAK